MSTISLLRMLHLLEYMLLSYMFNSLFQKYPTKICDTLFFSSQLKNGNIDPSNAACVEDLNIFTKVSAKTTCGSKRNIIFFLNIILLPSLQEESMWSAKKCVFGLSCIISHVYWIIDISLAFAMYCENIYCTNIGAWL